MRPRTAVWVLLLLCTGLSMTATVQAATVSVTIEAHDRASSCPSGKDYCYVVTEGDLTELAPGDVLDVVLRNRGTADHELLVVGLEDRDPANRGTDDGNALGKIDAIGPGETASLTLEVPEELSGLYLWCDLPAHERLGMWIEQPFGEPTVGAGQATGEGNQAPMPAALAVVAVLGAAVCLRQHRR